ncbi:NAD-dependent protein deacylase [Neiella marina]|uniref:NAD-dependent protein deacylase n=1 Tax=Neiella holothuriorum TaxID=2870530 RepID=A0ABS7EGP8_9GAMM|nr:Sir2 family NAD+-dependent deacetylase [Neiella holothuriorum]MBW8191521.1 NAD-dependent protein deacylase [Neiella holothuriorum]
MNIVVLTGAGISAESGIQTFRAADGLWEGHRVDDVATPEGFARNPALVHDFYNQRRAQLLQPDINPNAAHSALAALEKWADNFMLVTQNVDNLHERGGSHNVVHMHGELLSVVCQQCGSNSRTATDTSQDTVCNNCGEVGEIRPDIVWFGEMPKHMDAIYDAIGSCDLFISIGTSGNVYPAAGFVQVAVQAGAHTVELNLEPSNVNRDFAEAIYGPASEIVTTYVAELMKQ